MHPLAVAEEAVDLIERRDAARAARHRLPDRLRRPRRRRARAGRVLRIGFRTVSDKTKHEPEHLYGGETRKAIENFPISGEPVPAAVIHWLARIKGAAAAVNGELGLLEPALARRIEKAAAAVAAGAPRRPVPDRRLPDRLGDLVEHERQRGHRDARRRRACTPTTTSTSGSPQTTSSPRPSTSRARGGDARAAARARGARARADRQGASASTTSSRPGRTHLMDAVPVTLGQEFGGYAAQIRLGRARVSDALPRRRADPARRHRDRHRAQHPPAVRGEGAPAAGARRRG